MKWTAEGTPAVISPLQEYGYLGLTRNGLSYSLKPAGYDLLCSLGFDYAQDKRQPSHLPELHRRFEGASIFLTFYRAGMEVFSPQLSGLHQSLSYVHGSVIPNDRGGKEAQGIFLFLPYGEIFEKSCEPEQIYI